MLGGSRVQHDAAPDGDHGGIEAEDHPVLRQDSQGRFQLQLGKGAFSGLQALPIQQGHPGQGFSRAVVHMDPGPVLHLRRVGQQLQLHVDSPALLHGAGGHEPAAPLGGLLLHAGQIHGHPLPGLHRFPLFPVDLQSAHAHFLMGGQQLHGVPHPDAAAPEGARHHRTEAGHGKGPVDGQPCDARRGPGRDADAQFPDGADEGIHALPGDGGDLHHRRILQGTVLQVFRHILPHQLQPFLVHQVDLRQGHDPPPDAQQPQDIHMLPGLGHDPLVRGDDEQHQVDPGGPRQHGADEFFMPGHVHDADALPVRQVEGGEAQLDGDASGLLLLEPVGVDAGHAADKGRLAVVHVARGAHDDALFHLRLASFQV